MEAEKEEDWKVLWEMWSKSLCSAIVLPVLMVNEGSRSMNKLSQCVQDEGRSGWRVLECARRRKLQKIAAWSANVFLWTSRSCSACEEFRVAGEVGHMVV